MAQINYSNTNYKTVAKDKLSSIVGNIFAQFSAQILKSQQDEYLLLIDSKNTQQDSFRFGTLEEKVFKQRFIDAHNLSFPEFISTEGFDIEKVISEFPDYVAKLKINPKKTRKKELITLMKKKAEDLFQEEIKGQELGIYETIKKERLFSETNNRFRLLSNNSYKNRDTSNPRTNLNKPTSDPVYDFLLQAKENSGEYIYTNIEEPDSSMDPGDEGRCITHNSLNQIIDNLLLSMESRGKVKRDKIFSTESERKDLVMNESRYNELMNLCVKKIDLETGLKTFYEKVSIESLYDLPFYWENKN
jgi:hypothetical protein